MTKLRRRVEEWVRADALFRFGRSRYGAMSADQLVRSERRLRHALTGLRDLVEAAVEVGLDKDLLFPLPQKIQQKSVRITRREWYGGPRPTRERL